MDPCRDCASWRLGSRKIYSDGFEVLGPVPTAGHGKCLTLGIETLPDFGCPKFTAASRNDPDHVDVQRYDLPAWQVWHMGPCPDCSGKGSSPEMARGCHRCAGTGNVRFYDDGYVGEERTRLHPKEVEARQAAKRAAEAALAAADQGAASDPPIDGTVLAPLPAATSGAM